MKYLKWKSEQYEKEIEDNDEVSSLKTNIRAIIGDPSLLLEDKEFEDQVYYGILREKFRRIPQTPQYHLCLENFSKIIQKVPELKGVNYEHLMMAYFSSEADFKNASFKELIEDPERISKLFYATYIHQAIDDEQIEKSLKQLLKIRWKPQFEPLLKLVFSTKLRAELLERGIDQDDIPDLEYYKAAAMALSSSPYAVKFIQERQLELPNLSEYQQYYCSEIVLAYLTVEQRNEAISQVKNKRLKYLWRLFQRKGLFWFQQYHICQYYYQTPLAFHTKCYEDYHDDDYARVSGKKRKINGPKQKWPKRNRNQAKIQWLSENRPIRYPLWRHPSSTGQAFSQGHHMNGSNRSRHNLPHMTGEQVSLQSEQIANVHQQGQGTMLSVVNAPQGMSEQEAMSVLEDPVEVQIVHDTRPGTTARLEPTIRTYGMLSMTSPLPPPVQESMRVFEDPVEVQEVQIVHDDHDTWPVTMGQEERSEPGMGTNRNSMTDG